MNPKSSQPTDVTLLVVILHDANCLPTLLKSWRRIGVPGSTILPSASSYLAESWVKRTGLTSFLSLFDQSKLQQRTRSAWVEKKAILCLQEILIDLRKDTRFYLYVDSILDYLFFS